MRYFLIFLKWMKTLKVLPIRKRNLLRRRRKKKKKNKKKKKKSSSHDDEEEDATSATMDLVKQSLAFVSTLGFGLVALVTKNSGCLKKNNDGTEDNGKGKDKKSKDDKEKDAKDSIVAQLKDKKKTNKKK